MNIEDIKKAAGRAFMRGEKPHERNTEFERVVTPEIAFEMACKIETLQLEIEVLRAQLADKATKA